MISLFLAKASFGFALTFDTVRSAVGGRGAAPKKPAAEAPPTRSQIIAHYRPEPESAAPAEITDSLAELRVKDPDYRSHLVALTTALPLIILMPAVPIAAAVGGGLVWFGMLPLLKDGWRQLTVRRKIGIDVTNAGFYAFLLAAGMTPYAALGLGTYYLSRAVLVHTRKKARQKLTPLLDVESRLKPVRLHGSDQYVAFETLKQGDLIVVAAGDVIPADGIAVEGFATIDEHQLTGEMVGRETMAGDRVLAMTVVNAGSLVIAVERGWQESSAARLMHILAHSTDARLDMQIKADAYADRAAPIALLAGIAVVPFGGPMMGLALYNSLPGKQCRIVSPFTMLTTLSQTARLGVLVKDGRAFETVESIRIVAFDKTGTLTETSLGIGAVVTADGLAHDEALRLAAGVQGQLDHPIALALRAAAEARGLPLPTFDQIAQEIGLGIRGTIDGALVQLGSRRFMAESAIEIPPDLDAAVTELQVQGSSCVMLAIDRRCVAAIELQPQLRAGARMVVERLQQSGFHVAIISGDADQPTRWMAERLGVDSWHAGMLPHEKGEIVQAWQAKGEGVCYIGDGMNDGAALRAAALSISMKSAANLAMDEAQVILMRPDLAGMLDFFDSANGYTNRARRAFWCSTSTEVVGSALVLGAGGTLLTTLTLNHLAIWAGLAGFHGVRSPRRQQETPLLEHAPD